MRCLIQVQRTCVCIPCCTLLALAQPDLLAPFYSKAHRPILTQNSKAHCLRLLSRTCLPHSDSKLKGTPPRSNSEAEAQYRVPGV